MKSPKEKLCNIHILGGWFFVFCTSFISAFLSASVYSNQIPIIPFKLAGGFLAYLGIVIYPFYVKRIRPLSVHLIYFYYVGTVMAATFLARIRGEFEGAPESSFHYLGMLIIAGFFLYCPRTFFKSKSLNV